MRWVCVLLVVACGKTTPPQDAAPAVSIPVASVAPSASASVDPSAPMTFSGGYKATQGSFYVPDGGKWAGVKFRGEDASVGLGDGTMEITIDPVSRVVTGAGSGALGDVVVSGTINETTVLLSIRPKNPADQAFAGSGQGTLAGNVIDGTLRASTARANIIREATFSLKRK